MPNITMREWHEREAVIAAGLAARWPWLHRGGLRIESPVMSASADLESTTSKHDSLSVAVRTDRSSTIMGGPADVANAVRMLAEVRDAMLFIHGETTDLVIWQDGECPCGHCGARGTTSGAPCSRCQGTGKR